MRHDLEALKEKILIPEVWHRLGLAGIPDTSCHCPWRDDHKASFSIYEGGRRWKDHGNHECGDVIDFIARACGIDLAEATRRFIAMDGAPAIVATQTRPRPAPTTSELRLPALRSATAAELRAVAESRRIDTEAVILAHGLGTLRFGDVCGSPCWILTDGAGKIAEARRVDAKPFPPIGTLPERKAHTLKGSRKSWPVGVAVLREMPEVRTLLLVEGGPDYLAALHFANRHERWNVLPVAMLGRGTGAAIDAEALRLMAGRRIRIYPHADADGGGKASAEKWAAQLHGVRCQVDFCEFDNLTRRDGRPVKDLNDAAEISPEQQPELSDIIP